ncbi:MAG TPA: site-specific integrase, partial [Pirellulales bacterium]|nr:site-specific integrase [Pirellulales bacterium]
HRGIAFIAASGKRKVIRLGKCSQRDAESIKIKIEALVSAAVSRRAVDLETANWLADIERHSPDLAKRLVSVGLIAERSDSNDKPLGTFLDDYIDSRVEAKPSTRINLKRAAKGLKEFFGCERMTSTITLGEADQYGQFLFDPSQSGVGDNTARRMLGRAKQLFRAAERLGVIPEGKSPFRDTRGVQVRENAERQYFVSEDEVQAILAVLPTPQKKLIFVLARYGGLRCPSEHLALRWSNIDFDKCRMRIKSPKTEAHEGKDYRECPIFPELLPYLKAAWQEWQQSGRQDDYVIKTDDREGKHTNWRTWLEKAIKKAGRKQWPKLFQNMRSTRETELCETFPLHVVAKWIGNSPAVATKHYLQVTDEHFEAALEPAQVMRKAQRPVRASTCQDATTEVDASQKHRENKGFSEKGMLKSELPILPKLTLMPPVGLEPTTR